MSTDKQQRSCHFTTPGRSYKIHRKELQCFPETSQVLLHKNKMNLQSAYQEKIPARNAIYAHAQDFAASYELLLAILKAFIPQPVNKQQTVGFHVF
jgi:hypothetical protein